AVPDGGANEAWGADLPPRRFVADEQPPNAMSDAISVDPITSRSVPRARVRVEHKVVTLTSPLIQPQLPGGRHYITPRPELPPNTTELIFNPVDQPNSARPDG